MHRFLQTRRNRYAFVGLCTTALGTTVASCMDERPSSPYNDRRYIVICKNPTCYHIRYGSNSMVDTGLANFLVGDYGLNFAAKVAKALTLGVIDLNYQTPCQCHLPNGRSCGFTDCQFIDTEKTPNYWR